MGGQSKSLVHDVLSESHVHRVAFRVHDEFAGNITESARSAGERDISKRFVHLNSAVDK
jgi:NMD protein affecting ribosome stability and mRNA decay